MHEWLTVIIVLLIIGILLDGIRRMLQARRNSLRMSLDMRRDPNHDDLQDYNNELPNGGARVTDRKQEKNTEHWDTNADETIETSDSQISKPSPTEQQTLELEEGVPMLMDSVASIEPKLEPKLERLPEIAEAHVKEPRLPNKILLPKKQSAKKHAPKLPSLPEPKNQSEEVFIVHVEAFTGCSLSELSKAL